MRTRYYTLSHQDLQAGIDKLGLTVNRFAWLCGPQRKRVLQWLRGEEDIPHSTAVLLDLFLHVPGAIDRAREFTLTMLDKESEQ